MKKHCQECGLALFGRADKRFCSDNCRSAFHNKRYAASTFMRSINCILRTNRRILADTIGNDKRSIPKHRLAERGFRFSYFTNEYRTQQGATYRFCYDYGYLLRTSDLVVIVRREEYVE